MQSTFKNMKSLKSPLLLASVVLLCSLASCSDRQQSAEEQADAATEEVAKGPAAKSEETVGRVFDAEKVRSAEPVVFTNKQMSLIIAPDASVSLKRNDTGKVISNKKSKGWSIYNWWNEEKTKKRPIRFIKEPRFALDNM